ncbi:MAG: alpha/beta hydrolase [Clostridia bacterium]|nr:alpha/beta hydrolase [Clostridia bacterium]
MFTKLTELYVKEDDYENTMTSVVEPFLAGLREDGYFVSFDGNKIHYEQYLQPDAQGTVVIVHGFTESAEKFHEMSYNFLKMGLNVFAIDNRGHGRSYRRNPNDLQTVTVGQFEDYVEDLHCLVTRVARPSAPDKPIFLYAHSMGGAIAVQYLQTHPGIFDKAVLSSPMIVPQMPMPAAAAKAITNMFIALGQGDKMVFLFKGFNPDSTYETSHDTSKARFDYYHKKRIADPYLQTSSASYRWVRQAVKVSELNLVPERCKKIDCPVLLFQPEEDTSVISEKENEFIALVPDGRLVQLPNCRHEIYASVDGTVLMYLNEIGEFLLG